MPCSRVAAGDQQRPVPADVEPAGDGGDHAGAAEMFGNPVGEIGRHQRQRDLDLRIARPAPRPQAEPADREAEQDFAGEDRREGARGFRQRERAGGDRHHREAIQDQRGGVVGEALAFEDHQDAARQPELAGDRQRRHHVGRRDDGAEQEADAPRQPIR